MILNSEQNLSDEAIAKQVQTGNIEAFGLLVQRFEKNAALCYKISF